MKSEKIKILIRVVCFFLIFALTLGWVQDKLVKRSSIDRQFIPGFYSERENSLDAVYIGSSNCFTYWNSLVAFEEYGICVYPYSCNSQPFFAAMHLIKEARKTQPQATFIVNINSITDDVITVDAMHYLLDVMPFSLNKAELINHLSDIGGYSISERMEFYLPIIRFHSRLNEITEDDFGIKPDGYKGATTYYPYLNYSKNVSSNFVTTDKEGSLSEQTVNYTNQLLDYCDRENIKIIFVTVPQAKGQKDRIERYNALNKIIKNRGYTVLDLTEKCDEIGIDMTIDYYNGGHTNIHGSIKYTHYISEYLIKNFKFKDKRENKEYSDWQEAKTKYLNRIDSKILDIELDSVHRDYTLTIPSVKTTKAKSGVRISYAKSNNAKGYAIYRREGKNGTWQQIAVTEGYGFTDTKTKKDTDYWYRVVPFSIKGDEKYFGNHKYNGSKISL